MGELKIMKLFFGKFLWQEFLDKFLFLREVGVVMIAVYLGEFLCFPEVLGNAAKVRFCESRVIVKTR